MDRRIVSSWPVECRVFDKHQTNQSPISERFNTAINSVRSVQKLAGNNSIKENKEDCERVDSVEICYQLNGVAVNCQYILMDSNADLQEDVDGNKVALIGANITNKNSMLVSMPTYSSTEQFTLNSIINIFETFLLGESKQTDTNWEFKYIDNMLHNIDLSICKTSKNNLALTISLNNTGLVKLQNIVDRLQVRLVNKGWKSTIKERRDSQGHS